MTQELRIGWTAAILLHLLLLLFALFTNLPEIIRSAEFIEMQWGTVESSAPKNVEKPAVQRVVNEQPRSTAVRPSLKQTPVVTQKQAARPIDLPERKMPDMSDDVLSVPQRGEKMQADPGGGLRQLPERSVSDQPSETGTVRSATDAVGEKALPSSSGAGTGLQGSGSGSVGSEIGYSVQWTGGGTRRRISGKLPTYPEGTNVRAQVLIRAVVKPDGSVGSVTPVQKANTTLEEAAMRELRLWKFEALRSGVAQVDQDCVVTFLFTLK